MFIDPLRTPNEVTLDLASKLKALRLARNWKRDTLASRSGVSAASLKRFETTGQISLANLLRLCEALGRLDEFGKLLELPPSRSMAELEQASKPLPKRGRL